MTSTCYVEFFQFSISLLRYLPDNLAETLPSLDSPVLRYIIHDFVIIVALFVLSVHLLFRSLLLFELAVSAVT
jgi:hypothetical protein